MPQVGSLEREVGSLELTRCRDMPLFLYDWTIRYKQVVPIPNISFTYPQGGRITNLTFIARSHFESSLETVIHSCKCGTRMWMVHVRYLKCGNGVVTLATSDNNVSPNVYFVTPDVLSIEMGDMLGLQSSATIFELED